MFGFVLVPITAMATTIWRNRHPGVIVVESDETGMDPEIRLVLMIGVLSFMTLFAGLVALNYTIQSLQRELSDKNRNLDREGLN